MVVILLTLGILFGRSARTLLQENAARNLNTTISAVEKRLDIAQSEMSLFVDYIRENPEIKKQLAEGHRITSNIWLKRLMTEVINKNSQIYRASVISLSGEFLSTNEASFNATTPQGVMGNEWLRAIDRTDPDIVVFLPPRYDNWIENRHVMVYSLVKPVVYIGRVVGHVEIQRRVSEFSEIIGGANDDITLAIVMSNGKVFFSNKKLVSKKLINHYIAASSGNAVHILPNPFSNVLEVIAGTRTKQGWAIFANLNYQKILDPLQSVQKIIFMAILFVFLFSVMFIFIFSNRLTIPLRRLKNHIDTVNLDNLHVNEIPLLKSENDEISALQDTFERMQTRLKDAIDMEMKFRSLQAKAHFDALQARINPHFIFNVLGILVNMAEEYEQPEIADVCQKLSNNLRYTTQASDSTTNVCQEIENVKDYLALLKKRFEHRLEYDISVDEKLYPQILPKFCMQPLIENSVAHGFAQKICDVMHISILGRFLSSDTWEIQFSDNGAGFPPEYLNGLIERIEDYKVKVLTHEKPEELSIGGMGIINTIARLSFFFGDKFRYEIRNADDDGAVISLMGKMTVKEA
jgi:two-component system sensor histidine kinase YesM